MAVLGTVILVFIATHMVNFWAKMHFDKNMPLMVKEIEVQGNKQKFYVGTETGQYYPVDQVAKEGEKKGSYDYDAKTICYQKQNRIILQSGRC